MFSAIMDLLQKGVGTFGGIICFWGIVKAGLGFREGQGGQALSEAGGYIVGGGVMMAAATIIIPMINGNGLFG